ncbi:MAG: glutathione peroxidase [Legionella sp.]|nr:glutathione peroxidase [Legionella sp.]
MYLLFFIGCLFMSTLDAEILNTSTPSVYDYSFQSLLGHHQLPLSAYRGKVLFIVNVASKCGFTPQYKGLEDLYTNYKDKGLVIIGVPSNDFGSQEPGKEEDIAQFCKVNYGVTFPITAKEVVSGKNAHPFYLYAKQNLGFGSGPKWNFHKYLVDKNGQFIDYFYSTTAPDAPKVIKAIENALAK